MNQVISSEIFELLNDLDFHFLAFASTDTLMRRISLRFTSEWSKSFVCEFYGVIYSSWSGYPDEEGTLAIFESKLTQLTLTQLNGGDTTVKGLSYGIRLNKEAPEYKDATWFHLHLEGDFVLDITCSWVSVYREI